MSGTRLYDPPRNREGDHAKHGGGGPRILQTPIKQVKRTRTLRRQMSLPEVLKREGFRVMRIAARDVLKNMEGVLRCIVATCAEVGPLHRDAARRGSPPRSGEDLA